MENIALYAEVAKFTVIAAGLLIGLGALGTAIGGPVVFIAMAAPILASWLSRDRIVPLWIAALCGALMLLASDTLVRVLASPHEVATGIMTRILGGLLLNAAQHQPNIRKWLLDEAAKVVTRDVDKKRLAPLLYELAKMPQEPQQ